MERKVTLVERDDDPTRCRAIAGTDQCRNKCDEGFDYCNYHNSGQRLKIKKDTQRNYLLNRWQAEINQYSDNSQVKSLREEIGILRLLMQTVLEKCQDADDLMLYTPRMMDLVQRIERTVQTCHSLEEKTHMLVDKTQILHLAEQILLIISETITEPKKLMEVAERIKGAIMSKTVITVNKSGHIEEKNDF